MLRGPGRGNPLELPYKQHYSDMSFAGSVQAMITSLKNNGRQRKTLYDNKEAFKNTHLDNRTLYFEKELTPEQREIIIKHIKAENKNEVIKKIIAFIIALIITTLIILIIYGYIK